MCLYWGVVGHMGHMGVRPRIRVGENGSREKEIVSMLELVKLLCDNIENDRSFSANSP